MKEIFVWLHKDWHRSFTYKQDTMDSDKTVLYYSVRQVDDKEYNELVSLEMERVKQLLANMI